VPQGEVEIKIAAIWSELLKVERVGRHDNFFELGGHSLLLVRVISRMKDVGIMIEMFDIIYNPTIASLSARL
jgi:aryl carrier-like protein